MRLYKNENECEKRYLKATLEAQFMRKISNTETDLKKSVAYKKTCSYFINGNNL